MKRYAMLYLLAFVGLTAPVALAVYFHLNLSDRALFEQDERDIQKLL